MEMDRRTFMQGAALSVGGLLVCSANLLAQSSPTLQSPALQPATQTDAGHVLKVIGWDRCDHSHFTDPGNDEVFIHVGQTWRTAWR
jgi:phosphodiesterase/alkaline phosphatase D-like protein